jgi:hypothetical protein
MTLQSAVDLDGDTSAWTRQALTNCKAMVAVFSKNSKTCASSQLELEVAKANRIPVLPLLHSGDMKIDGVSPVMFHNENDLHISLKKICNFLLTAGAVSSKNSPRGVKVGGAKAQRELSADDDDSIVSMSTRASIDVELSDELKRSLHAALDSSFDQERHSGDDDTIPRTRSRSGSTSSNIQSRSQSGSATASRKNSNPSINVNIPKPKSRSNSGSSHRTSNSSTHSRNGSMNSQPSRSHSINSTMDNAVTLPEETLEAYLTKCNLAHFAPALRELGAYTPSDLEVVKNTSRNLTHT